MLPRSRLTRLNDYALPLARRDGRGAYFARLCDWNDAARDGLWRVHELARQRGVIIEDRIPNPDEHQLNYLTETLGAAFEPSPDFAAQALSKWTPRMSAANRQAFVDALLRQYQEMRAAHKPDGALKNLYVKWMCWLYYRFERLMPFLGSDEPPKILYVGSDITAHELSLLRALNEMGMDVLLVEPRGDAAYLKLDPQSQWSQLYSAGGGAFPADWSMKQFRREMARRAPAGSSAADAGEPGRPIPRCAGTSPLRWGSREGELNLEVAPHRNGELSAKLTEGHPPGPAPAGGSAADAGEPGRPIPRCAGTSPLRWGSREGELNLEAAPHRNGELSAKLTEGHPPGSALAGGRTSAPTVSPSPRPPILPERYFKPPTRELCTNAWMKEPDIQQVLTPIPARGEDPKLFYNAFIRLYGVRDRLTYANDLRILYQHLISIRRTVLALDGPLPAPEPEALAKIRRRGRYRSAEEMIVDLAGNLPGHAREELQRQMQRAFVQVLTDAAKGQPNLNRLLSTAVKLLCHILRYQSALFAGWKETDVPVFILMGGCQSEIEALYVCWLSRLPVDVLLLAPNLDRPCLLQDDHLLELRGEESLPVMRFPKDEAAAQLSTAAAHAERDLDTLLYQDSGLYRNRQFARANAVTLRTTADEAFMLWDQELKYRTGFSAEGEVVSMPVIYAKFSGVEGGKLTPYWHRVKQLTGKDVFYIPNPPMIPAGEGNRMQAMAIKALRHGRVSREAIRNERQYPFGLLREELQQHIFEKLQWMIDHKCIRGTFVNGTEYTVVGTVLGMNRELLRLLQAFDFTKRNPKLVCVYTREQGATLEDAIMLTFLNLVGFDIALFVPTGYQVIEGFLSDDFLVEHQLGEYVYDLTVPDLDALPPVKGPSWFEKLLHKR